eukprot:NODE_1112_length_1009_cov_7.731293_g1067_i0.p1 GENE.NODE_1112_length_1009_cov_7.731293_g1067_i0~~NODE_1112_length_1009_cov_7.731293_g1067_i0.p1  ORF type:complete len:287 (-),score=52.46 NODE_1112_length_1009_cov_7.731293_g1067_i0:73-933(-)
MAQRSRSQPSYRRAVHASIVPAAASPTSGALTHRAASPTASAVSQSSRLDGAHRKMLEQLARHEKEYDRALRVKHTEIMRQQQRLEKLEHAVAKEEAAAERAQRLKEERVRMQRMRNQRKADTARKGDQLQQVRQRACMEEEAWLEDKFDRISARREMQLDRVHKQAVARDEHRAEVYVRSAMLREAKKDGTLQEAEKRNHAENKARFLAARRKSLADRNAFKAAKHEEARRRQNEVVDRARWDFECKTNEEEEVAAELAWMGEQVARDRHELDMALQRLRTSKFS